MKTNLHHGGMEKNKTLPPINADNADQKKIWIDRPFVLLRVLCD